MIPDQWCAFGIKKIILILNYQTVLLVVYNNRIQSIEIRPLFAAAAALVNSLYFTSLHSSICIRSVLGSLLSGWLLWLLQELDYFWQCIGSRSLCYHLMLAAYRESTPCATIVCSLGFNSGRRRRVPLLPGWLLWLLLVFDCWLCDMSSAPVAVLSAKFTVCLHTDLRHCLTPQQRHQ